MYNITIQTTDFDQYGNCEVTLPNNLVFIQIYSSNGSSLLDNCNATLTNNYLGLSIDNFITADFPLTIIGLDDSDAVKAFDLFDATRTSSVAQDDLLAVGKKNYPCRTIKATDLYTYMADNLGYLSNDPYKWVMNSEKAQQKLNLYSKEQFINIDKQAFHINTERYYSTVTSIQPVGSYDGIVDLMGMRVNDTIQYYKINMYGFHWRGLGRGAFFKLLMLGPGSPVQGARRIFAPTDIPVFMFADESKSIDINSTNGWFPPMFIITPTNKTISMGDQQLEPSTLYFVIFDWTTGSGIPDESASNLHYSGKAMTISDLQ